MEAPRANPGALGRSRLPRGALAPFLHSGVRRVAWDSIKPMAAINVPTVVCRSLLRREGSLGDHYRHVTSSPALRTAFANPRGDCVCHVQSDVTDETNPNPADISRLVPCREKQSSVAIIARSS